MVLLQILMVVLVVFQVVSLLALLTGALFSFTGEPVAFFMFLGGLIGVLLFGYIVQCLAI